MLEIKNEIKIVIITPAGRKRYLEFLVPQIVALRPFVDEYRLWVNTINEEDIKYMESLEKEYSGFIKLERLKEGQKFEGNLSIHYFFKNCCDPDTVYVRFDDDIIYIDRENFTKFVDFRYKNPKYFLVYGNILNNGLITHVQQKLGNIPRLNDKMAEYDCTGQTGWNDPSFAEHLHRFILRNPFENFRFPNKWVMTDYERVSINCISWIGAEFGAFDGNVGRDEELWLSVEKPKELQRPNCIFGDFVCLYYAFHTQRDHLDSINILSEYYGKILNGIKGSKKE